MRNGHGVSADLAWAGDLAAAWRRGAPDLAGRARIRAGAVAFSAGLRGPWREEGGFLVGDGPEGPVRVLVVPFAFSPTPAGEAPVVRRLLDRLSGSFGEWRFAVHIRERLPDDFDPGDAATAAHLWRMATDRGERGHHASYEAEDASLDLSMLRRSGDGGPVLCVGPLDSADRLLLVYHAVHTALADAEIGDPIIVAAVAEPAWRLPKGLIVDFLYGTQDAVCAGPGWTGAFRAHAASLFGSHPSVAGLWWIEADHPAAFRATAYENPWHPTPGALNFPGDACRAVRSDDLAALCREDDIPRCAVGYDRLVPTCWSLT